jgi:hypothetical protein
MDATHHDAFAVCHGYRRAIIAGLMIRPSMYFDETTHRSDRRGLGSQSRLYGSAGVRTHPAGPAVRDPGAVPRSKRVRVHGADRNFSRNGQPLMSCSPPFVSKPLICKQGGSGI